MVQVKFWGVRGSVPSPLRASDVKAKIHGTLLDYIKSGSQDPEEFLRARPFYQIGTYGGNTSCVELNFDGRRVVLDMGTGLRELGNSLLSEMVDNKGLAVSFCLSHVHWDHIQGLPFFSPLYANKWRGIRNNWTFYGGTDWQKRAELCLRGQMDPPTFPVSWDEICNTTESMNFHSVCDSFQFEIDRVRVKTRKLNHPQETYGYRFEYDGLVIVYTTDNEPYDPEQPDQRLLELAQGADLWITDCQYDQYIYNGSTGGVPRHGWGHSYDVAVAKTSLLAQVKHTVLFHHDPVSSDWKIWKMEERVRELVDGGLVSAAAEGMTIDF